MKTFKLLTVAAMLFAATSVSAQFVNSTNTQQTNTTTATTTKVKTVDTNGWTNFSFSYLPSTISADEDYALFEDEDMSCHGFSLGLTRAFGVVKTLPLFVEAGIQLQYRTHLESDNEDFEYGSIDWKTRFNMFSINIPVNLGYKFNINQDFAVMPYFGLDFRFNLMANINNKYKLDLDSEFSEYEDEIEENLDEEMGKINLFDKDDMGDEDYTWKRFQAGWHIGASVMYKKLTLSVNYGTDFSEIAKKTKLSTTTLSLGVNF